MRALEQFIQEFKATGVPDDKLAEAVLIGSIVFAMLADAETAARPITRKPNRTRKAKRRNWSG